MEWSIANPEFRKKKNKFNLSQLFMNLSMVVIVSSHGDYLERKASDCKRKENENIVLFFRKIVFYYIPLVICHSEKVNHQVAESSKMY